MDFKLELGNFTIFLCKLQDFWKSNKRAVSNMSVKAGKTPKKE